MRLVIEIVISFDGYVSTFFLRWSLSISLSISDSLLIISPSPFFFGFHTNSLSIFKSSSCHLFLSSIYTSACSDLFFLRGKWDFINSKRGIQQSWKQSKTTELKQRKHQPETDWSRKSKYNGKSSLHSAHFGSWGK